MYRSILLSLRSVSSLQETIHRLYHKYKLDKFTSMVRGHMFDTCAVYGDTYEQCNVDYYIFSHITMKMP